MLNLSTASRAFFQELWQAQDVARFIEQLEPLTRPITPIELPPGVGLVGLDTISFEGDPSPQPSLEASVDDFILPEGVGSNIPGLIPDLMPDVDSSFVNEIVTTEVPIDVPTVFADSEDFLL